ncbi:Phospho-2-dehydro-3-deoxyheptonate aldolase, Tyr-sensitive [Candidatus Westeberhardia cardiocondylae]|uniref:Phospho-2-dehydro-3-deoxyheptonate aldolase n=1 Tax=Candidatus Westeberhardia cardiocondylae TaxID=1594731 RepID=A0A0H5BX18_9ENTR|nr:3-deoxy-7-phosphoheptulonate synthase [Candidatus Westeberhardia cardiocondylae]CEN32277.1 Phospho-2-dehydro-3-deoxyheptonate aldolase, Tyr-sensitive [Candidatus Westeberhardia cardiocondylae]
MDTTNKNNNHSYNEIKTIITPRELKNNLPLKQDEKNFILESRNIISNIIHKHDSRILVICGPCSIHDIDAAIDYANKLKKLSQKIQNKIYLVMRTYFEKPRTIMGWKGLINDPYMDGSYNIEKGLYISRSLLLQLTKMKIPLATEALDTITPNYLNDLFSWSAIGARTNESQIHREMASGLPMPIGFKNGTDGNIDTAINSIQVASVQHYSIGINQNGRVCIIRTKGNKNVHIILRGGKKPNYYETDIINCEKKIKQAKLPVSLMVDCSHGNSNKNYKQQTVVAKYVLETIKKGNDSIIGIMLESYINSGNQSSEIKKENMQYGVSVTDACINWKNTEKLLLHFHEKL